MYTIVISYLLVWCLIALTERYIRQPSAKSFRRGANFDRTSLIYLTGALLVLLSAPVFDFLHIGIIKPNWYGWIGLGVMLAGVSIRVLAMLTLGKFYTRALMVVPQQTVVQTGLYAYVRHPGYTGTIIAALGFAIAQLNWFTLILTIVSLFIIYPRRIGAEEKILVNALGDDYRAYMRRTKKLLPFIY